MGNGISYIMLGECWCDIRHKKRKYLKDKMYELAMNSKNWNMRALCRGINEFKKGYQMEL
jgi:hypothetical protein